MYLNNYNCRDEYINFHIWEGIKKTIYYREGKKKRSETVIVGKSEINRKNGHYFCYTKRMTYKELLYNNQIIKKDEKCKDGYKNCGIIDTLEQQLCMPQDDECPLYDVGISEDNKYKNNTDYTYAITSRIYYNKNTYNEPNKKIIGKIVLSDGEPCYNINEKLWRSFLLKEVEGSHLECELEVFGKKSEDRYKNIGDISYYKIYKDNIDNEYLTLLPEWDLKAESLSLYKREFLGIDKECDEKSEEFKNGYDKLKKSQESEKLLLLIEPLLIFAGFFTYIFVLIKGRNAFDDFLTFILIFYSLIFVPCIICHSIFLSRIIQLDSGPYECSDNITNEVIRKETLNTKKTIIFTGINLGADILIILIIIFLFTYSKCQNFYDCICDFIKCKFRKKYKGETDNNNDMRDVNINNNKNKIMTYKSNSYSNSEQEVSEDLKDIGSKEKM